MRQKRLINNGSPVVIGYRGENNATQVYFDIPDSWNEGSLQLRVLRPGDSDPYVSENMSVADGRALWNVSSVDTAITGRGVAQFCMIKDGAIIKSQIFDTQVLPSVDKDVIVPEPEKSILDAAVETATAAAGQAEAAAEIAKSSIYEWFTLSVNESTGHLIVTEKERSDGNI